MGKWTIVVLMALCVAPVWADEYTAPVGEERCVNTKHTPSEFQDASKVWWGHKEKAHAPYMRFAKTAISAPEAVAFEPVYFDLDKAELRPEGIAIAGRLARFLGENPGAQVRLSGHACDWATHPYNMKLGQQRADAVKSYLVEHGVEPSRIETVSHGEEQPAVPNNGERELNRRVEITVQPRDSAEFPSS